MPRFSVIIPNYNHAAYLEQRIQSVINQSYGDFELIILDDASTDNSRQVIEQYRDHPKVSHIVYNDSNSGSAFGQWKKGIEAARGDWIWIAESDDWSDLSFLQTADAAIQQYPATGIFYCDANIADEKGQLLTPGRFSNIKNDYFKTTKWSNGYQKKGIDELNEHLKLACIINNANSTVLRKDLLLPLMNEIVSYKYHGDWFCYIRLALTSDIVYTVRSLSTVRLHSKSLINKSKDPVKSKQELFQILVLLQKQKDITEKNKLLRFFSEQYLGIGFIREGFARSFKTIALYPSLRFWTGIKVVARIFWIKLIRKKVKPVF